ncbi:MAG: FkbM family methyltransferase [Promethearchaeota archaeon]|jgi:FkbM family methyltransferase
MFRNNLGEVIDHLKEFDFRPNTIIDVGVAYGTPGLYGKFENTIYLLIEPLIEYEESCKNLVKEYGGDYVIAAASDFTGEIIFNVHPDLSGSSLFNESEGKHVDGVSRTIYSITLDEVCKIKKLHGPFLIKIDVQGAELKVLSGAQNLLPSTEVIILEAFLFPFYKEIPLLIRRLRKLIWFLSKNMEYLEKPFILPPNVREKK